MFPLMYNKIFNFFITQTIEIWLTVCGKILQPYSTTKPYVKTLSDLSIFKGISNIPQHIISHLFTKKNQFFHWKSKWMFYLIDYYLFISTKASFFWFWKFKLGKYCTRQTPYTHIIFQVCHACILRTCLKRNT